LINPAYARKCRAYPQAPTPPQGARSRLPTAEMRPVHPTHPMDRALSPVRCNRHKDARICTDAYVILCVKLLLALSNGGESLGCQLPSGNGTKPASRTIPHTHSCWLPLGVRIRLQPNCLPSCGNLSIIAACPQTGTHVMLLFVGKGHGQGTALLPGWLERRV